MALTINTNLFSLNAQRNLRASENPLQTAMQRLSSGLKINSAKDDAAGLAIATRMQRQITGLSVAMRNANDGASFAQTAEGGMAEMVTSLQRIYELANQSASYNTSLDRSSINQEVSELLSELNRVVSQTRYNGEQFLNKATSIAIQVGTEVNETLSIATANVAPTAYGVNATRSDFTDTSTNQTSIASAISALALRSASLASGTTLAGQTLGNAIAASVVANNSLTVINRINEYTSQTDATAFAFGNGYVATLAVQSLDIGDGTAALNAGYLTINGVAIGSTINATTNAVLASHLVTSINNQTTSTGVTAVLLSSVDTGASTFSIAFVNTTGAAINISVATANSGTASAANSFIFGATRSASITAGQNGQIVFSAPLDTTTRTVGTASDMMVFGLSSGSTTISLNQQQSVNSVSVTTTGGASLTILAVKEGLEALNTEKAKLGAKLNRLDSTIRNLDNVRENITAARSRIMDADFAIETANMTRAQIMQQAGISILSQANSIPQQVLTLLGR
ncbi:MAG: flagellin [Candidatus Tectomicrobia bacterium]|uniref:Flagellin n=1 Tax=Tectimicrobiota bacterium TaxID=2528274 RepID=A0A932FX82_UNCTE|nr:flagellin [Candidatus Tectomicrobia bacterium]